MDKDHPGPNPASALSAGALPYPEAAIEAVVRLLAKVASMQGSLPSKKRTLVNGLATILDADGWLWSATRVLPDQDTPMSVGVLYDGLTEEEFSGWVEASQVGKPGPPEDPPLTALFSQGKHYTRTRQQLVPDDVWYSHPTVKKYRLDRGIDHFVYTVYPLGEATCSAIGFFRRLGREPFDELERRVCHLVECRVDAFGYLP